MTGWWDNLQYRGGVAAFGMVTAEIAIFLGVMSAYTRAAFLSWQVIVFLPLVMFLLMYAALVVILRPWRTVEDIRAMLAGRAWVHWTYDETNWRAANRYDGRTYVLWVRGLLTATAAGALLVVIGIANGRSGAMAASYGGGVLFIASTPLAALLLGNPIASARRAKQGEIYVSRRGIYRRPGGYTQFDLPRNTLKYESVDLVDVPTPHIHIVVLGYVPGNTGGSWKRRTLTDLGVPPGHEDEARTLVEQLRNEVVNAAAKPRPRQPQPERDEGW